MTRVLAVRLDSDGDVLVTGPAVRALTAIGPVELLVSHAGLQAARLLPGVRGLHVFDAPWTGLDPVAVDPDAVLGTVRALAARRFDVAVVFTSFHQDPLPTALLLRLAGLPFVAATSEDFPGTLLDVRHHRRPHDHEVTAALDLAVHAGGVLPAGDDGRLAVRGPLPPVAHLVPAEPFVALHPSASVAARALPPEHAARIARALVDAGWEVVVTGGHDDRVLTRSVAAASGAVDLGGRTTFGELAAVLTAARTVVVGNTGPAHLAAAVGTPVVSLFSPVVPAERWRPFGVPQVLLGDQHEACAGTRARDCPVAGHPCLASVDPRRVVEAVATLAGEPAGDVQEVAQEYVQEVGA